MTHRVDSQTLLRGSDAESEVESHNCVKKKCETVGLAILATSWLLVYLVLNKNPHILVSVYKVQSMNV